MGWLMVKESIDMKTIKTHLKESFREDSNTGLASALGRMGAFSTVCTSKGRETERALMLK